MAKTGSSKRKELANNEKRLICELKNIAKKISRNKAHNFNTEKLETAFAAKCEVLKSKGVKIKDYAMFEG